jgi:glutamate mutase epsilon subunit
VPTTTDSYTRNEQFDSRRKGIEESSGRPLDAERLSDRQLRRRGARQLVEAIDKPAIMLTGTSMPKLTGEIGFAGGYTGYLGSGIAYTCRTPRSCRSRTASATTSTSTGSPREYGGGAASSCTAASPAS